MKKRILSYAFILFLGLNANAQFLHFGAGVFTSPAITMEYFPHGLTDYVYYFANEKNETIRFSDWEYTEIDSKTAYPNIYIRFDIGNYLYVQTDLFYTYFSNKVKFKNSVDYKDFIPYFNPDGTYPDVGYNSLDLDWSFWGNSLEIGWAFRKTKSFRPTIFLGLTMYHLASFGPSNSFWEQRERFERNTIILNNLDTFKKRTLTGKAGIGLKYHGITLEFYATQANGNVDDGETLENGLINKRANYSDFGTLNVALNINLLSFNLSKNRIKK